MSVDDCGKLPGKNEWPELVGSDGDVACKIIEQENSEVDTHKVLQKDVVTHDYVCTRVWVWVDNDTNLVTKVPVRG